MQDMEEGKIEKSPRWEAWYIWASHEVVRAYVTKLAAP